MKALPFLLLLVASISLHAQEPPTVAGYTGEVSHWPGEELALHVSTNAPTFSAEIARLACPIHLG